MNIKSITVVVEAVDVTITRGLGNVVDVTIHHPRQRNVAVPYAIQGDEGVDVKAAQTIIERATSQDWKKSHTCSMVSDLVDVLRQVAGV